MSRRLGIRSKGRCMRCLLMNSISKSLIFITQGQIRGSVIPGWVMPEAARRRCTLQVRLRPLSWNVRLSCAMGEGSNISFGSRRCTSASILDLLSRRAPEHSIPEIVLAARLLESVRRGLDAKIALVHRQIETLTTPVVARMAQVLLGLVDERGFEPPASSLRTGNH